MILLDTCAIIHAALTPDQLGPQASAQISQGMNSNTLACGDISLWEIAMLIKRGRLKPAAECTPFLTRTLLAFSLTVLPIIPEIAVLSADDRLFRHKDPCDRIIAATALHHALPLISCDGNLSDIPGLITVW
jgi:PIN domain nuclease of toxin-antitoxin system